MKKTKIYIVTHSQKPTYSSEIFEPIQVGKAVSGIDLGILADDTGENISKSNPWFCELTALYWVWKNQKDLDYVGFCHYRRLFTVAKRPIRSVLHNNLRYYSKKLFGNIFSPGSKFDLHSYIDINKEELNGKLVNVDKWLQNNLEKYDLIFPKKVKLACRNIKNHTAIAVPNDMIENLGKVIQNRSTEEGKLYRQYLKNHKLTPYNMFVMKWEYFDQYMTWLFGILEELQENYDWNSCKHYNRCFGYLSEALMEFYFENCFTQKTKECRLNTLYVN